VLAFLVPSDPDWVRRALHDLDEILVDHAHCEKKAASSALALLFRYPERLELAFALTRLAREELAHYEEVLGQIQARGIPFGHRVPAPYAGRLMTAVRREEPRRLLDSLLCMALIEARSCERMRLLAEAVPDPALARFYGGLLRSEARHYRTYVSLAERVGPRTEVRRRLEELARHEAEVLARVSAMARMHG